MAEKRTDRDLVVAGWARAELDWEGHAEAHCAALAGGDEAGAKSHSGRCVFLAREAFAVGDPRLATALANHAACLARQADEAAGELWQEAVEHWARSDSWIAAMTAPRVAKSSLFHMRMEQRHRPAYEARWRAKWQELGEEAKARLASADPAGPVEADAAGAALARWRRERPAMLNDTRKLMAAVILLLPGR